VVEAKNAIWLAAQQRIISLRSSSITFLWLIER
jgi:hypothetical protein